MNKKYIISGSEFETSDDEIEYGDFFVDIKSNGTVEPYIHQLIGSRDYILNGIDVITLNRSEFEWNKDMANYKKIINL
jgi:hypothetical protein